MEKFLIEGHGIEALAVLLALNVLTMVGKFLYRFFLKKSDETDKNHKSVTDKTHKLTEEMAHLRGSMDRLQMLISSYMETTIGMATKLGATEKQVAHSADTLKEIETKISKMARYDDDMRRLVHAIKWIAGPERWNEIKDTILKDEFRS